MQRLRHRSYGIDSSTHDGLHVAVLATFYNANWCRAHLAPIAMAKNVRQVTAVVDGPTAELPGVEYVYPPPRWTRIFGRIVTKLLLLLKVVWTRRSDVVVGYFLVPNGMWALASARLLGRLAVYQNTVGPTEIVGGGSHTDNRILQHLGKDSWILERLTFAPHFLDVAAERFLAAGQHVG